MRVGMTKMTGISMALLMAFCLADGSGRAWGADNSCAEYEKSDAELNKAYKKILNDYKQDQVFLEKLKQAQKAWLAFRDAHVNAVYPEADKQTEYGSAYGMCRCLVLKELTEVRVEQLKKWVDGVEEGDVCAGSVRNR